MTARHVAAPIAGILLAAAAVPASGADSDLAADVRACHALQEQVVGPGRISSATFYRAPTAAQWTNSASPSPVTQSFCRLEGDIRSAPGAVSRFEVWLPARAQWNGRFLGVGAGGSMGDVNRPHLAAGVNRGYAAVATDNGHRSLHGRDDNQWALGHPERIVDFGYRANHLATVAGKAAVARYYGRRQTRAYFYGCSQGGLKGLMEAQRFPEDYDGIVAAAPIVSWVDAMTLQAWGVRAVTATPQSRLGLEHLEALHQASARKCAGPNGVILDPRSCDFDPAEIQCPRSSGVCLSADQVTAARKLYDGPSTPDGRKIYPGYARGTERLWDQFYLDVSPDGARGGGSWLGVYRYMVKDDPTWTLQGMDFASDWAQARSELGEILDARSPNLDRFSRSGGKLIVVQGWADHQVAPQAPLDYRAAVIARTSSAHVDSFLRLFMAPGMAHCQASAPGPNLLLMADMSPGVAVTPENDALAAVQAWVEDGRAPERMILRLEDARRNFSSRTVLLCSDPQQARYGGGNPDEAASWVCASARGARP